MIIVSQNREQIINFNTLSFIGLSEENMKQIVAHDVNKHVFFVGIYETEERAKEVLKAITIAYGNIKMINIPKIHIDQEISSTELIRNFCYCMPEK